MSTTDLIAKLRERTSFSNTDLRLHKEAADALTAQAATIAEQARELEALKSDIEKLLPDLTAANQEIEQQAAQIEALRADAERLTNERAVFGRWMSEALLSLGTMSEDEMEDGGDYHRMFMDRGRRLADAAMQSGKAVTP